MLQLRAQPQGDFSVMGAFLAEANAVLGPNTTQRLMLWVVDKQKDYGAWFYTPPAKDSHITHDITTRALFWTVSIATSGYGFKQLLAHGRVG